MKKTFGVLIQDDKLYVIIVGKLRVEIKEAYVYKIDENEHIVFSIPSKFSEEIGTIWPPKNVTSCSPEFTPFCDRYFATSLDEAKNIRKKICADKIKKAKSQIEHWKNGLESFIIKSLYTINFRIIIIKHCTRNNKKDIYYSIAKTSICEFIK